ncbi:MAG: 3-oxoacyl-ACP synthase III [Planctomycetaceae bacterium]|nr:3-oxoacyl-ACP synthase III [Planctomycetaceae bacterium]
MKYQRVFLESIVAVVPEEVVTTDALERRLEPLYSRLKLPEGRLELMTGIKERRLWPQGELPGTQSIKTVRHLLELTGIDRSKIGCFVHASVCRDFLEPATACRVHDANSLPANCAVYDVSNACLGILSGMVQIANMIELGQIEAGIVAGTESSRALLETTIAHLNTNPGINRKNVKTMFASLTIGSGSAAVLLTNEKLSTTKNRLLGGVVRANTTQCRLCQSETDQAGSDSMQPLMQTDSETLMHEGVATAKLAFDDFLPEIGWQRSDINKTFCHQVGKMHQQLLFERLGLDETVNFATLPYLGNTGSVALPTAAAFGLQTAGLQTGFAKPNDRIALLGIGSGINVIMLGLDWQKTIVDPTLCRHELTQKFLP